MLLQIRWNSPLEETGGCARQGKGAPGRGARKSPTGRKQNPEPPGIGGLRREPDGAAGRRRERRVRGKRTSSQMSRTWKARQGEQESETKRPRIREGERQRIFAKLHQKNPVEKDSLFSATRLYDEAATGQRVKETGQFQKSYDCHETHCTHFRRTRGPRPGAGAGILAPGAAGARLLPPLPPLLLPLPLYPPSEAALKSLCMRTVA